MSTLVDANVLIDIYEPGSHWAAWSESQLKDALLRGLVVISQVVAVETADEFTSVEKHEIALRAAFIRKEDIPWEAAFLAGSGSSNVSGTWGHSGADFA